MSVLTFVYLLLCVGCQPAPPESPVWERVKFKDLAAVKHSAQTDKTVSSPLQFTLYVFSIPADNFAAVKDIWTNLSAKSIRFTSEKLFGENGFVA
ncbi:MAG: hypothetical protein Q7T18_10010, partial [Sedimentisphaerales bacterium]|nr:hypothetical protein [Sedimentisphaerales bacterium]